MCVRLFVTAWESQFLIECDQICEGVQTDHGLGHRRVVVRDMTVTRRPMLPFLHKLYRDKIDGRGSPID